MKSSFLALVIAASFFLFSSFALGEEVQQQADPVQEQIEVLTEPAPKVLVVSDIDDTIKVSHVLGKIGKYARAVDATTPFLGMSELYQLIVRENPSSTKIAYLSNAPKELLGIPAASVSHQFFLDYNRFPKGELILRDDLRDQEHKSKALRVLIEKEKPDVLILIGDNGERDVDFYRQATQEHAYLANMQVITFIHQLYKTQESSFIPDIIEETGRALYPEQIGFVTPIEVSLKLRERGLLSQDKAEWMIKNIVPRIVQEDRVKWDGLEPIAFPSFKNCAGFVWNTVRTQQLNDLLLKIENKCN